MTVDQIVEQFQQDTNIEVQQALALGFLLGGISVDNSLEDISSITWRPNDIHVTFNYSDIKNPVVYIETDMTLRYENLEEVIHAKMDGTVLI